MAKATAAAPNPTAASQDNPLFKNAARTVLLGHYHKMMDNLPGTRAGEQIEALHQMRVGSRRLRAALSVFAKVFPKDEYQTLDKQAGDITDALGAVRDLDVQMEHLRGVQRGLPENQAYGVGRLVTRLEKQRDKQRKKLVKALDRLEKEKFGPQFLKALDRAVPAPAAADKDAKKAAGKSDKPDKTEKAGRASGGGSKKGNG